MGSITSVLIGNVGYAGGLGGDLGGLERRSSANDRADEVFCKEVTPCRPRAVKEVASFFKTAAVKEVASFFKTATAAQERRRKP